MTALRTAAQQALEAMLNFPNDISDEMFESITALKAALAEPVLQTCNCRWNGEVQVQQCTLHEAHVDAIHEWAERAKTAEKKLAALAEPVQEPVAWGLFAKVGKDFVLQHPVRFSEDDAKNDRLMYPLDTVIVIRPLYTAPPQRKPLTEEEKRALADKFLSCQPESYEVSGVFDLISAVERAHEIT